MTNIYNWMYNPYPGGYPQAFDNYEQPQNPDQQQPANHN